MVTITFQVDMAPVKALEDRAGDADTAVSAATALVGQLQESVKRDLQQNKAAMSQLKARKLELLKALDVARGAVIEQQRKVDQLRAVLLDNERVQSDFQQRIATNQGDVTRLESDIQLHREGVSGINGELENINQEIEAAKTVLGAAIQAGESEVAALKVVIDEKRARVAEIEQMSAANAARAEAEADTISRVWFALDANLDKAGVRLDELKQQHATIVTANQAGELEVAALKVVIDEKRARVAEIEQMSAANAARAEAEADTISREWQALDANLDKAGVRLDELRQQHATIVTAKGQDLAILEARKDILEGGLIENEKDLSSAEANLVSHKARLVMLEADERALETKWDGHVQAVIASDAAITTAEGKVLEVEAQAKETEDRVAQLNAELEAAEGKVARLQFTAGMAMTTISMGFRITRRLFKGLNAQFDQAISYLASMFSHVATMAWQASALAAATGNVVMAGMHMAIAIAATAQQTSALVERVSQQQQAEYNQRVMMGDR